MAYADNESKFVAVVNQKHPLPVVLNALAHAAYGLSGKHAAPAGLLAYSNTATGFVALVHQYPFIVLSCTRAAALRKLLLDGMAAKGIVYNAFSTSMIGPSALAQREATARAPADDIDLVVVLLFGRSDLVDPLTRKFSLLKGPVLASN